MTVKEIAAEMGLTRPTAHNIATTLFAERYLTKLNKPTRYLLGPAVSELLEVSSQGSRRSLARKFLEELISCHPGVGFVYAEAGSDEMRLVWRADFKRPEIIERVDREVSHPYETATALVFHAFADEPRAVALRKRFTYETFGQPIWGPRRSFDTFLADAQRKGYCMPSESVSPREMSVMAVPIFGAGETLVGSLGAFWSQGNAQVDVKECLANLLAYTKRLNRHEGLVEWNHISNPW